MGKAEIVMIHEDVRGRIFRVTIDEYEFYVLETRRGYARGGHSHTEDSYIAVLEGRLEYKARIVGTFFSVNTTSPSLMILTSSLSPILALYSSFPSNTAM